MEVTVIQDVPCAPQTLFRWVGDLANYGDWLTVVHRVHATGASAADPGPAWLVDLRGRFGPLARSKRLRVVRSAFEPGALVVFERREIDGRQHAPWRLRSQVAEMVDGARLVMHLEYAGGLWGPMLDRILKDEIERGRERLVALATRAEPTR